MSPEWQYQPAGDHGLSPLEALRSVRREPGLISCTMHRGAGLVLRASMRVYHRLRIRGGENLPGATPFVLIASHTSHMDALILAATLPFGVRSRAYPVAAGDVFFETLGSSVVASTFFNALPLWRKRVTTHALEELRERLLAGESGLILFPEGARSRDGAMLPFKAGLGRLVAGTAVPVVPCHIEGAFAALRPGRKVPRPARITVRVGAPLCFEGVPATRQGWESIATALRASVETLRPERGD